MKFATSIAACLALAGSTVATPIQKRAYTDADILNYALTLEHLENTFYRQALKNYTEHDFAMAGFGKEFYVNLKEVAYDETTHVKFLTSALEAAGAKAVKECTYAFGVDTPAGFVALASVLEGVGVSAYLGAAGSIMSKTYLTAAGSILTTEARHNAYIRSALKQSPFPQAFDVPLDFAEVYTLASPFIVSCPADNPTFLPLKAFPALMASSAGHISTGATLTLTVKGNMDAHKDKPVYAAFVLVTGRVIVPATPSKDGMSYDVVVPPMVHGQSYILLTSDKEKATDDTVIAGPAIVEIMGTDGSPNASC